MAATAADADAATATGVAAAAVTGRGAVAAAVAVAPLRGRGGTPLRAAGVGTEKKKKIFSRNLEANKIIKVEGKFNKTLIF